MIRFSPRLFQRPRRRLPVEARVTDPSINLTQTQLWETGHRTGSWRPPRFTSATFLRATRIKLHGTATKESSARLLGRLDTSIIIPWLRENYGCQVIAICGDVGQGSGELEGIVEKAKKSGAVEVFVEDMREEFVRDYVWPMVRSGAIYEAKYLLGTSIARPLLAKRQVEIALETGCDALSHGATGKGNDQVRFELTYKALAPHLPVIAPWREWSINSREDAIDYAAAHDIPIDVSKAKIYSRDRNLWHISHEGGELEDPANAPSDSVWMLTSSPKDAPDTPADVAIEFEKGTPVAVNGEKLSPASIVETLNTLGGSTESGASTWLRIGLSG